MYFLTCTFDFQRIQNLNFGFAKFEFLFGFARDLSCYDVSSVEKFSRLIYKV